MGQSVNGDPDFSETLYHWIGLRDIFIGPPPILNGKKHGVL